MGNDEVFRKVQQGFRLEKPAVCPDPVYTLMIHCWASEPEARPTADTVAKTLASIRKQWTVNSIDDLKVPSALSRTEGTDCGAQFTSLCIAGVEANS
jgi:hypothetical protein